MSDQRGVTPRILKLLHLGLLHLDGDVRNSVGARFGLEHLLCARDHHVEFPAIRGLAVSRQNDDRAGWYRSILHRKVIKVRTAIITLCPEVHHHFL